MTTKNPSLEEALKAAQSLMDGRLAAVEAHKASLDAEAEARALLAERERETARTWAELLAAGWTASELTKTIGFTEPKVKAPGRPRGSRSQPARSERPTSTPSAPPRVGPPNQASPTEPTSGLGASV